MNTDALFFELAALQANCAEHDLVMTGLTADFSATTQAYKSALDLNSQSVLTNEPLADTTPQTVRLAALTRAIDIERELLTATERAVSEKKIHILQFDATAFN